METDGLTKVSVALPGHWAGFEAESFWAKHLGGDLYRLENVPFYAYGLNYLDVVRAIAENPDTGPEVKEVVEQSGHRTMRVLFFNRLPEPEQTPHLDPLLQLGVTIERANNIMLALDIPPGIELNAIRAPLERLAAEGLIDYETCEVRLPGTFTSEPEPDDDEPA